MKLTIKESAPYLPNGAEYCYERLDICGDKKWHKKREFIDDPLDLSLVLGCDDVRNLKIVLHPLSDLKTKALPQTKKPQSLFEWEGELYDISDAMREIMELIWKTQLNSDSSKCIGKVELYNWCVNETLTLPFYVAQELIKRNFDVFDLIPNNFAIDINTLDK